VQILHPGDVVRVRRRTWRVVDVRPYDTCGVVSLLGTGANTGNRCDLLAPFDHFEPVAPPPTQPRRAGSARWRRAAMSLIGRGGAPGLLRTAATADIDVLPYQLEPAISVLRGDGCRLLLADEVGLGKTIQACLLIAELRVRGVADRVLILSPPGLRDQWCDELGRRFHISATIADVRAVRRCSADVPPDVNPWTTWPVAVASIDYVKRPEVLRAVLDVAWDIVIVDEAHSVANDGIRRNAAAALTSRAAYVVLLTATPHSGHSAAFQSLCSLGNPRHPGADDDRLLIFRRTRGVLASGVRRRVHRLHVHSTPAERRMLARLDTFADAVRAERGNDSRDMWIALSLLHKRARSSARALQLSVRRRLDRLATASPVMQLALPLDDFGEASDDDSPEWHPALELANPQREQRLLNAIADAAKAAVQAESKIHAIRRLLRRIAEPVIIFTEYRDTLAWLAVNLSEPSVLLHGGLPRQERREALNTFVSGRTRLLLATDAAAEGLNLHQSCRVVVNLELPWNPMRLEQRIGRVDRIGQRRAVHVIHLIGADTGEARLLDDLRARIAHARADVGAPDPLDGVLEAETSADIRSHHVDVAADVLRTRLARLLPSDDIGSGRPLVRKARHRRTRSRLAGRTLSLWECVMRDAREQIVSSYVAGVLTPDAPNAAVLSRCSDAVADASSTWIAATLEASRSFAATGRRRAETVAAAIANDGTSPDQPGLFDRRVEFARAALNAAREHALATQAERIETLQHIGEIVASSPRLRLLLVP